MYRMGKLNSRDIIYRWSKSGRQTHKTKICTQGMGTIVQSYDALLCCFRTICIPLVPYFHFFNTLLGWREKVRERERLTIYIKFHPPIPKSKWSHYLCVCVCLFIYFQFSTPSKYGKTSPLIEKRE